MKTIQTILLFLLAILASCSSDDSSSGNSAQVKSIMRQDFVGNQWYNTTKTTNFYEGNNTMMSSSLFQSWSGENWRDIKRSSYSLYDGSHASQQIEQNLNYRTGIWNNDMRYTFTYNAQGKIVKEEQEIWTSENNWLPRYRTDYIYDGNAFLISKEYSEWYAVVSLWDAFEKVVYTNNSEGKPIYTEHFNMGELYYSETTTYDTNGFFLMSEQLSETLQGVSYVYKRTEQTTLPNGNISCITKTSYNSNGEISQVKRFLYSYY